VIIYVHYNVGSLLISSYLGGGIICKRLAEYCNTDCIFRSIFIICRNNCSPCAVIISGEGDVKFWSKT
jgi:hypothetical protein